MSLMFVLSLICVCTDSTPGPPSLEFCKDMTAEHTAKGMHDVSFTTSNYGVTTTPSAEWEHVANGTLPEDERRNGRRMPKVDDLMQLAQSVQCGLTRDEVVAVVLYTGPMVSCLLFVCCVVCVSDGLCCVVFCLHSSRCTTQCCDSSPRRTTTPMWPVATPSPPPLPSWCPLSRSCVGPSALTTPQRRRQRWCIGGLDADCSCRLCSRASRSGASCPQPPTRTWPSRTVATRTSGQWCWH